MRHQEDVRSGYRHIDNAYACLGFAFIIITNYIFYTIDNRSRLYVVCYNKTYYYNDLQGLSATMYTKRLMTNDRAKFATTRGRRASKQNSGHQHRDSARETDLYESLN